MANEEMDDFEGVRVSFETEEGSTVDYVQEMIIPVDGQDFALLLGIDDESEDGIRYIDGEEDVIITKIVKGEDGEDIYVEPTDEEFAKVEAAYNKIMDEYEAKE